MATTLLTADPAIAAAQRIDALNATMVNVIKSTLGQINREFTKNRDKLTSDKVQAAVGVDKVAMLKAGEADMITLINKYFPGTFPE